MQVTIRTANTIDIPCLVEYWQSIDTYPKATRPFGGDSDDKPRHCADLLKHTIQSGNAKVLIAEVDGVAIGTISGHVFDKPAVNIQKIGVIYSLWVEASHRRHGIGEQLLQALESALKEKGALAFQVGWDSPNHLASSWWQKHGYSPYEVIASKLVTETA